MAGYEEMVRRWCGEGYNGRLPPPVFTQELKLLDRRLVVRWCDEIERWQILWEDAHPGSDGTFLLLLFNVEEDDGGYRDLDGRVLERLKASDTWAEDKQQDWLRKLREERAKREQDKKNWRHDYLLGLAKEQARFIRSRPSHKQVV